MDIIEKKKMLADGVFEVFDFDLYEVVDHDGWEYSSDNPSSLSKIVYIAAEDTDAPSEKVSFTVTFDEDGELFEAYALLMSNGMEVGFSERYNCSLEERTDNFLIKLLQKLERIGNDELDSLGLHGIIHDTQKIIEDRTDNTFEYLP